MPNIFRYITLDFHLYTLFSPSFTPSADQEITGDILLELNIETLKELDIPTFGKRFKIMSAINSLKEEAGLLPKEDGENKLSVSC